MRTRNANKEELVKKYEKKINGNSKYNSSYGALVENMDENVGKLLHKLDDLQLSENTIVIFFSDNGGLAAVSSQSPLRGGKGSYYEGGIRVPCIIKWPKQFKAAQSTDMPVTGMDIYPTLLDLVGDKTDYQLEGKSLLPFLQRGQTLQERALFWHFPVYLQSIDSKKEEARDPFYRTRPGSVIRKGKWKLHQYFENNELELYDLEADLGERNNVAEKYPAKVKELYRDLKTWQKKTNAPIPTQLHKLYKADASDK